MGLGLGLGLGLNQRGGAPPFILDQLGVTPFAAYSLRQLRAAYSGPCIRARRSSDNAQEDFGFAGGWLNSTALLSWAGAASVFVVTDYDQSGNARDITQATAASQPRIVNAGVLDVAPNGRPWLWFTGSHFLASVTDAALPSGTSDISLVTAGKAQSSGSLTCLISYGNNQASGGSGAAVFVRQTTGYFTYSAFGGGFDYNTTVDASASMRSSIASFVGATSIQANIDGVASSGAISARNCTTPPKIHVGANLNGTERYIGGLGEVFVFGALSDAQRSLLTQSNRTSWGTP